MCRCRRRRRRQRGAGKARALARRGFVKLFGESRYNSPEGLKAQFARRHVLPLLYKNRKLHQGRTIGGVKFRVDKRSVATRKGFLPTDGIKANKKILGYNYKKDIF